ncbi:PD-(D/E)XK nuclease family protein, partial [Pediococcus acidilactici]|nr:PD-(D/E)XK nuclease family protein [Pediococcus acidilactici]
PKRGNDGTDFKLSPYVERIKAYFEIEVQCLPSRPAVDQPLIQPFIGSKRSTLSHLVQYARSMKESKQPADVRWNLIYSILEAGRWHDLTERLMGSLSYKNVPRKLKPDIVTQLYGDKIYASVSKLEEFFRNEYSYFLKYGLKLQERETADLSPADTGQYFHAAMDNLVKVITQADLNFNEVNQTQIKQVTKRVLENMRQDSQFDQFNSTYRMGYLRKQLDRTVETMVTAIFKQLAQTRMRPIASEQMFGQIGLKEGLPALNFKVNGKQEVNVRGKIDRIDKINIEGQPYLGVVDYKSSTRKFDFADAYYGLAMQMLLYLDVVQQNRQRIDPHEQARLSSALYMIFQDPLLKATDLKVQDEDQLQQALFKKFSLNGFVLNNEELLKEIDKTVAETGKSAVYPFDFTKSGSLTKASLNNVVSETELQDLIKHAEEKVIEAGKRIFSGEVDLNPVQWPDRTTALEYSPYKEIMQFDAMLPENNYRVLEKLDKETVLRKIEEERKKNGN